MIAKAIGKIPSRIMGGIFHSPNMETRILLPEWVGTGFWLAMGQELTRRRRCPALWVEFPRAFGKGECLLMGNAAQAMLGNCD